MILGMSTRAFTLLHVAISLIGSLRVVVEIGLWRAQRSGLDRSLSGHDDRHGVTGFFFHSKSFGARRGGRHFARHSRITLIAFYVTGCRGLALDLRGQARSRPFT